MSSSITGEAAEDMDIGYDAAPMSIGFNSRYLADVLGVISGENVRIEMSDPGSPAIFRPDGDLSRFYVLMPMRVP